MNAAEEHLATRCAAGLFDFSFMALYEFSGIASLRRVQTRDAEEIRPGQIAYTLLLKDDGAVLIDATLWRLDAERFWLFTGRRIPLAALDRSGEHTILALQGPASGRILARLIGAEAVRALKYFHFARHEAMTVARLGFSGELGYELIVPAADASRLRPALLEAGSGDGLRKCGWAAANSLRIEAGYVLFDREVDGRANPRELGLERLAIGRAFEITRKLVGLEMLERAAPPQLPLATVTSECHSPTLGRSIALGFAPPASTPGSLVRHSDGRMASVASLPFYDPERRRPRENPL